MFSITVWKSEIFGTVPFHISLTIIWIAFFQDKSINTKFLTVASLEVILQDADGLTRARFN